MINKQQAKKQGLYYLPMILVTFLYMFFFRGVKVFGDDLSLAEKYIGLTPSKELANIIFDYTSWSSRVLVNMAIHIFMAHRPLLWVLCSGILIFMMLLAMNIIFNPMKDKRLNYTIILIFLIFPIIDISGPGWRVGTISYLWPISCAVLSSVPLTRILRNEKIQKWEAVIAIFALFYAANQEQCLVVLFCLFGASAIYFFIYKKRWHPYFIAQCLILIGSLLFFVTCPGNGSRGEAEMVTRFKDYIMLNPLDKLDLGISSSLHFLFTGENIVFLLLSLLMAIYIITYYETTLYRIIGLIPLSIVCISKIGLTGFFSAFTNILPVFNMSAVNGLISVDSYLFPYSYVKYTIYFVVGIALLVGLYLVFRQSFKSILCIGLFIGGLGSRFMLGFSPSVWVSGNRTYTFLFFSLLVICILIIKQFYEDQAPTKWGQSIIYYCLILGATLTTVNLLLS